MKWAVMFVVALVAGAEWHHASLPSAVLVFAVAGIAVWAINEAETRRR